jgi:hypothetical protein
LDAVWIRSHILTQVSLEWCSQNSWGDEKPIGNEARMKTGISKIGLLLFNVLVAMPALSQEPVEGANVFGDLSYPRTSAIFESRRLARTELPGQSTTFATPDIATALGFGRYLIAIARITAVQPANGGSVPRTTIRFHVEEFLRGESDLKDFEVESKWTPIPPPQDSGFSGPRHSTVLDRSEPRKGDQYLLGYSPDFLQEGKPVFALGVVDMQDPGQAALIGDVEKFIAMESAAGSRFEPYLDALNSAIPCLREIAVHRLSDSDLCNASAACIERFSSIVRRQMQSAIPDERLEASRWLVWIASVSRFQAPAKKWPDGMPILPDSLIRRLWSAAIDDPNVYIGDEAYQWREMFDFERAGKPGDCIQIVPALRKSAHWLAAERSGSTWPNLLPVNLPLVSTTSCIPGKKP